MRRVRLAYLQSVTTLKGFIHSATTIDDNKYPEIKMWLDEDGLLLNNGKMYAIIPLANVKIAALAADETLPIK